MFYLFLIAVLFVCLVAIVCMNVISFLHINIIIRNDAYNLNAQGIFNCFTPNNSTVCVVIWSQIKLDFGDWQFTDDLRIARAPDDFQHFSLAWS